MSVIEVLEPATEQVMAELPRAGAAEVDAAVARAKAAFPAWRALAPADRWAPSSTASPTRSTSRREELAPDGGAERRQADRRARGEIEMVADTSATTRAPPSCGRQTIPVAGGMELTFREPVGVVGRSCRGTSRSSSPPGRWRRPSPPATRLSSKPAELTPLTASSSSGSRSRPGLPEGVLNVLVRPGASAAGAWSATPASTRSHSPAPPRWGGGSAPGAPATIKRISLELGGKSANLIFADADLDAAAVAASARLRQRRPGLLRPAGCWSSARHSTIFLCSLLKPVVERAPGRRPARRCDPDGPADLGRPAPAPRLRLRP